MIKSLFLLVLLCGCISSYGAELASGDSRIGGIAKDIQEMNHDELANAMESYRLKAAGQIMEKNWSGLEESYFTLSCIFIVQVKNVILLKVNPMMVNTSGLNKLVYNQVDFMTNLFGEYKIPNDKFSFDVKRLKAFLKDFLKDKANGELYSIVDLICIDYMNALQAFLRFSKTNGFSPENLDVLFPIYTNEKISNNDILVKNGCISLHEKYCAALYDESGNSGYSKYLFSQKPGEFGLRNINTNLLCEFLKDKPNIFKLVIKDSTLDFNGIKLPASLKQLFLSNSKVKNINFLWDLEYLGISECNIEGINIESKNEKLNGLSITNSNISEVGFIEYLAALKFLDLSYTKVYNLNSVCGLEFLEDLRIGGTKINNLNFINSRLPLKQIFFSYTDISDISPLFELRDLELVNMMFTKVDKSQYDELLKRVRVVHWKNINK